MAHSPSSTSPPRTPSPPPPLPTTNTDNNTTSPSSGSSLIGTATSSPDGRSTRPHQHRPPQPPRVRLVFRHGQTLLAASGPLVEASLLAPSALLQGMLLEGEHSATSTEEEVVRLPTVDRAAFETGVLPFLRLHAAEPMQDIPRPLTTQATLADVVQPPFDEFIYKLGYKDLVQVVELSDFLGIEPLLSLALARVHFLFKTAPLDEFRALFALTPDLSPEEERALRREYLEGVRERNQHLFPPIVVTHPPAPPLPTPTPAPSSSSSSSVAAPVSVPVAVQPPPQPAHPAAGATGGVGGGMMHPQP